MCSCRKNSLRCVAACGGCHGDSCENVEPVLMSNENDVSEDTADEDFNKLFDERLEYFNDVQWMGEEEKVLPCDISLVADDRLQCSDHNAQITMLYPSQCSDRSLNIF